MTDCFTGTVSVKKYTGTVVVRCRNLIPVVTYSGPAPSDQSYTWDEAITPVDYSGLFSVDAVKFRGVDLPAGLSIDEATGVLSGTPEEGGTFLVYVEAQSENPVWVPSEVFEIFVLDDRFITTWETTTENEAITLPIFSGGTYDFIVDWGDGSSDRITSHTQAAKTHIYATPGIHTVAIRGQLTHFRDRWDSALIHLKTVEQLGSVGWEDLAIAFYDCPSLTSFNAGQCDISGVEYIYYMCYAVGDNFQYANFSGLSSPLVTYTGYFVQNNSALETIVANNMNFPNCASIAEIFGWSLGAKTIQFLNNSFSTPLNADQFCEENPILRTLVTDLFLTDYQITNLNEAFIDNGEDLSRSERLDIDISELDISQLTTCELMFRNSGFSDENYDKMLIAWEGKTHLNNVLFHAGNARYSTGTAKTARTSLIGDGWEFIDGGMLDEDTYLVEGTLVTDSAGHKDLPLYGYSGWIDWGDGTPMEEIKSTGSIYLTLSHDYPAAGEYNFKIQGFAFLRNSVGIKRVTNFSSEAVDGALYQVLYDPSGDKSLEHFRWGNFDKPLTQLRETFRNIDGRDVDITGPDVSQLTDCLNIFKDTRWSSEMYDKMLLDWSQQTLQSGVTFSAPLTQYTEHAAKATMEAAGWTFVDAGRADQFRFQIVTTVASTSFTLPLLDPVANDNEQYNFLVDWGDTNSDTITSWNQAQATHVFATAGTYEIVISGTMEGWQFGWGSASASLVTAVHSLGSVGLKSLKQAWGGCDSLVTFNAGQGDLSTVTDLYYMMYGCQAMTEATISGIDVSNVTDARAVFPYLDSLVTINMEHLSFDSCTTIYAFCTASDTLTTINNKGMSATVAGIDGFKMFAFNPLLETLDMSIFSSAAFSNLALCFKGDWKLNPDLSLFNITQLTNASEIVAKTAFSDENYDKMLVSWEGQPHPQDISFGAGYAQYTKEVERSALINDGWIFEDRGTDPGKTAFSYIQRVTVDSPTYKTISLPFVATGDYNCVVDWGDGTQDLITAYNQAEATHTYESLGFFQINIEGVATRIDFNASAMTLNNRQNCWHIVQLGVTDAVHLNFSQLPFVRSLYAGYCNLTQITSMENFVAWNDWIERIDLSGINTMPLLTSLKGAFKWIDYLTELDLSPIPVDQVTNMEDMVSNCAKLLKVVTTGWDTAALQDASNLAFSSDQLNDFDISHWDISALTAGALSGLDGAFDTTSWTTAQYDAALIAFAAQTPHTSGVYLDAGNTQYSAGAATTARGVLTTAGWNITDGGQA